MSAERISRAAVAAEQLCAALWEALHEQLRAGDGERAAALSERVAEVARSISALAKASPDPEPVSRPPAKQPVADRDPLPPRASASIGGAVLVDERESAPAPISIRDARPDGEGMPWSAAVQRRLDRYLQDREPFAVLLVELLDAKRLRLSQALRDAEGQLREVESSMVEQLRPADTLVRETDGRYWLVAPGTAAEDAHRLALQLAAATRRCASHRGAPLEIAVGIAICPDHGVEAAGLAGHAEVDLYAAQASGRAVSDPGADGGA